MEKIVIIINGNGGVGKDTLCDFASLQYRVTNVSSVTPIKKIAEQYGWRGEKDARSRKFLADLKRAFTDYNDLPYKYLVREYEKFLHNSSQILFVHIREGEEIEKFKRYVELPCATLLIKRDSISQNWGNTSDDNVENYKYDYIYNNNKTLSEAPADFGKFLNKILTDALKKRKIINQTAGYNTLFPNRLAGTITDWNIQKKELLQKRT